MSKRHPIMIHRWLTTLLVILVLPALAQAGLFDRFKSKDEPVAVPAVRFDRLPPLDYAAGTLTVDSFGRYRVGQCSLQFDGDSRIQHRGKTAGQRALRLGQQLVVSGHPLADGSLMVRTLTIMEVRAVGLELADYPGAPVGELAGDAPN